MKRAKQSKLLAALLAAVMILSMVPTMAFAADIDGEPAEPCTVTEGCTLADGHEGECVTTPDEPESQEGGDKLTAEETLAEMIAALPNPADIDPLNEEQVEAVDKQLKEIYAFAEENGIDVADNETINAVIAAAWPAAPAEDSTTISVASQKDLVDAFKKVKAGTAIECTISLSANIVLTSSGDSSQKLKVGSGKTVTLLGNGHTITYGNDTESAGSSQTLGVNGGTLNLGSADGKDTLTITTNNANNHADPLICVLGGGTVNMYKGVTLTGNTDTSSSAGGVEIQGGSDNKKSTFIMHGGTISNCISWFGMGGGVRVIGDKDHPAEFIMHDGVITGNQATGKWLSGYAYGGGVCVTDQTSSPTTGTEKGGGSSGNNTSNVSFKMYGGTIEQNSSAMYGGGVYVGTAHFEFHGGTVQNNTAGTNGGGLYLSGKTLGLTGIGFDGTVDDWSAGGEIEIPMGVSAFRSNDNGAAAGSGKFFVTGNQVNGTASASGGGIYVGNCTDLKLSNVKINSNGFGGSNGQGAGVYITGCSGAEFLNCAITENKNAAWGCGLSVSSSASAQIKDCVISKNTGSSTCQGGGVYTQGTVSFTGSSITGNSAGTGGGVYVRKGTATFDSTAPDGNILCNNTANTEAADVYAAKDNTTSVPLPDAAGMKQVYAADGKEKTIDGWYWDASDSRYQPSTDGIPYNNDPAFGTANVSLIASYKDAAEYTITFQPGDHGTLENAGTDGNVTHTLAEGNAFPTPPETTPEKHYAFDGWYNADGKKVENFPKTVTANATYTAHWKKASVTVTYQFVGEAPTGAVVPASETVNIGTLFTPTAPAEVEGWKFDGWYKENDCTEKFTDGTTLTSDTTLYGKWMEKAEIFNTPPVITAEDKTLTVGDAFDPMADVTASDAEDGDITKDIKVISNTVDTSKAGVYEVTYQVRDSQGASCTKTIKVTVKDKDTQKPTPDDNDKPGNNTGNPTKPDGTSPQTGDTSHIGLWISLLAVSLLGIGAALLTWKKKTCRGRWEK